MPDDVALIEEAAGSTPVMTYLMEAVLDKAREDLRQQLDLHPKPTAKPTTSKDNP